MILLYVSMSLHDMDHIILGVDCNFFSNRNTALSLSILLYLPEVDHKLLGWNGNFPLPINLLSTVHPRFIKLAGNCYSHSTEIIFYQDHDWTLSARVRTFKWKSVKC